MYNLCTSIGSKDDLLIRSGYQIWKGDQMWRSLLTRMNKTLKASHHRSFLRPWSQQQREPEYEINVTRSGTEIQVADPKVGCAVYYRLKRQHPDKPVLFETKRLRCSHCGWKSPHAWVSIRLPSKGQASSDFVLAEFSKKFKAAVDRTR